MDWNLSGRVAVITGGASGIGRAVASVAGQIGSQTDPPYSASKAANINFLSSDRAAHVAGQTINVDGGFVMHW
jgi:NAD(P)-dependent dehydrogenase (short-subunit alcohol dehydrogenase family)